MKKILLVCCLMVAANVLVFGQTNPNPITQAQFNAKVTQLNTHLSQSNLASAQVVWTDINNMMMIELDYLKSELNYAITNQDAGLQVQFTTLSEDQSTFYSEAMLLYINMLANQTALINKLGQFAANI